MAQLLGDTPNDFDLESLASGSATYGSASGGYWLTNERFHGQHTTGAVTAVNRVHVYRVFFNRNQIFASIHFWIGLLESGKFMAVGIYSNDGNTKLIDSGAISVTTANLKSATLGAPVTLTPGFYWIAYTADGTTAQIQGVNWGTSNAGIINAGVIQMGRATNVSAVGVLPATLGTISAENHAITPTIKLQS